MDDETRLLVRACENTWHWYCVSLDKKTAAKIADKSAWERQAREDFEAHLAARKALEDHLAKLIGGN